MKNENNLLNEPYDYYVAAYTIFYALQFHFIATLCFLGLSKLRFEIKSFDGERKAKTASIKKNSAPV